MTTVVPVSVVIPCYRCAQTLGRAVASVAAQTSLPMELILIDDASADETRSALHDLPSRYPPGWIKLVLLDHNVGAAGARNAGWAMAAHPYVAFLDADDAWHPQKIELQYAFMVANPNIALCGHGYRLVASNGLPNWRVVPGEATRISKWALLLSNKFVTPSVMLRRDVAQRFNERQRFMEDHLLWLEIFFSGARVVKLPAELAAIYKPAFGSSGLSAEMWLMERGELGNYQHLYDKKFIRRYQFIALVLYSLLKHVRRLFIYWGYLQWKR